MADESPETTETDSATGVEDTVQQEPANQDTVAEAAEATPPAEEAPAKPDASGGEAAPAADAGSGQREEPAEVLSPKEARRRARSTHTGKARATRSAEDRHAERLAARLTKARHRSASRANRRAKRPAATDAAARAQASDAQSAAAAHDAVVEHDAARKVRQGVVLSDKADKTITVRIASTRRHRRYEKIVRSSSTLHAHDENNEAHEGDVVRVVESRPLSRSKRWRLVEVVERAR
ncbi:MAG: 30S ribosomal protein S17 [Solirubrobacteraceae bacterium]